MNVWILTIGNSDIQLKPKNNWTNLYRTGRSQLKPDRGFSPSKLTDSDRLRVPARVMGVIYSQPQASLDDLDFPLIDNFIHKLKTQQVTIDKVILVLSDQSIFPETKRIQKHPYWQDTCTLQPILEKYLTEQWENVSPDLEIQPLLLEAISEEEGLDNWNAVLKLVQKEFTSPDLELPKDTTVYVSHQAGTPAISSAVQFCSLAKFGDRVRFLVSNEQDKNLTDIVKSSSYLRGIKREQAMKLLNHHDYLGVQDLLVEYLEDDIKTLLESAIQWNFAHFAEGDNLIKSNKLVKKNNRRKSFVEILSQHPDFIDPVTETTEADKWWWTAYEAAYLGFIRLKQGNTVEAVFQSFRSVEGLLKTWAEKKYPGELINTRHPNRDRNLRLYGEDLYTFLNIKRNIDQGKDFDIWVFGNVVLRRRNELFHNIKGLNDREDVFEAWRSSNEPQWKDKSQEKWKSRVLNCLNFIVRENFAEGFKSLEEASLMVKVHQELGEAIANL
jgi:hypothetical protein